MKRKTKVVPVTALLIICLALPGHFAAAASGLKSVAVFPFDVMAKGDMHYLGQGLGRMLCSRIGMDSAINVKCLNKTLEGHGFEINDNIVAAVGMSDHFSGIDYILTGSMTVVEKRISTDAVLVNIREDTTVSYLTVAGTGTGDILRHAEIIATQVRSLVNTGVLPAEEESVKGGKELSSAASVQENDEVPVQTAFAKASASEKPLNRTATEEDSGPSSPKPSGEFSFENRIIKKEIKGIATGDVNGDGRLDIAVVDEHDLLLFSFENKTLVKAGQVTGKYYNTIVSVDAFDADSDGKDELFVTVLDRNNSLDSLVVKWKNERLTIVADNIDWYLRTVSVNGKKTLLGQKKGFDTVFFGSIYVLAFDGSRFRKTGTSFPGKTGIYGFTPGDFSGDGNDQLIWFDKDGVINISQKNVKAGRVLHSESFGSSPYFIDMELGADEVKKRVYLNNRIFVENINHRGNSEIITIANRDLGRGYLSGFRRFDKGTIKVLEYKETGLVERWSSDAVSGFISDFDLVDINSDGLPELVYTVVTGKGAFSGKTETTIVAQTMANFISP